MADECRKRFVALAAGLGRVVREDISASRWDTKNVQLGGTGPNFGAQVVHNNLQLRSSGANESALVIENTPMLVNTNRAGRFSKPPPTNLQNQEDVISIKASRVFPIAISAAKRSHNYH
jgi:hypothetical protein